MNSSVRHSAIPIIDISPLNSEDLNDMKAVAQAIGTACMDHGFFYVIGHGVSISLQDELTSLSKQFFSLSEEEKMKISMKLGGRAWRGYFPLGDELTSGRPDQKEGIYFGTELSSAHPKVVSSVPLHGANLFPEKPERLGQVVLEYMEKVTQIGHTIMRGIAISLGLEAHYFEASVTKDPFILFRIFHYPASNGNAQELWGVGEHTDYGLLTILKQDEVGGLQVRSKGDWIDAPPVPNSFICNIGDMLDRMTNGLYLSTPHRVRNTSGKNRLSFPLFFDPGFDVMVERIPGTENARNEATDRWDDANVYSFEGTYGSYLLNKVSKVFPQLRDNL